MQQQDTSRVRVRFVEEFYYLKVPASHLSSWWIWKRIPISSYTKIVLHTNDLHLCILCGGDFIVYSHLFIGFYGFLPDWFYSLLTFIYWLLWLFCLIDWFHSILISWAGEWSFFILIDQLYTLSVILLAYCTSYNVVDPEPFKREIPGLVVESICCHSRINWNPTEVLKPVQEARWA